MKDEIYEYLDDQVGKQIMGTILHSLTPLNEEQSSCMTKYLENHKKKTTKEIESKYSEDEITNCTKEYISEDYAHKFGCLVESVIGEYMTPKDFTSAFPPRGASKDD